ncbi:MAG TPA: flagellar type III secretion system pore protein FliP [Terriglobales bacterium]|nr:flagellar type III secretion system pore protein FliP [Terriglobales bacterium]
MIGVHKAIAAILVVASLIGTAGAMGPEAATEPTPATPAAAPADKSASAAPKPEAATPPLEDIKTRPGEIRIIGVGNNSAFNVAVLLTFLTLIPSILLCVTPFARLLVVFHFLRQALGLQTTPSNQTLIGLALILTFFLMQPVGAVIVHNAVEPYQEGRINAMHALNRASEPVHDFMLRYVREKDLALFVDLAKEPRPHDVKDLSMRVVVPAYIISELRAGFQIGAVLFLPFLIIDMVVASITTSIGMFQLPPVVISTPIKLLLFVMVDGWNLVIGSLMKGFA